MNRNGRERFRDTEEDVAEAPKKSKLKRWLVIIPITVVLLVAAFMGYAYLTKSFIFAAEDAPIEEKMFSLDSFVLNLKDDSGRRYIKTELVLSYGSEKQLEVLQENVAQIRDSIIAILRSKTPDEMMDVAQTDQLKSQIRSAVNTLLGEEIIIDVYFVDFMIQ